MSYKPPSNFRPLAIFTSYMVLALTLTLTILNTIAKRRKINKSILLPVETKKIRIFAVLAILSLGTTWYYMFQFFALSYRTWASNFAPTTEGEANGLQLGLWLRDSRLFEEAWGFACATPHRWWWTQQIFLCTTMWSLILGREGTSMQICFEVLS
jgi:hypothetical protein